jgi:hypothetical protein
VKATWETSFVAVGLLLGEPAESLERALGGEGSNAAVGWLHTLVEGPREARARAIARVVSEVAVTLDAVRLA